MAPKITLEAVYQEGNFHIITIDKGEISFGRGNDNTVVVDAESVSRHHGIVKAVNNHWIYTDCGSLNGSFCNDLPLQAGKVLVLNNGDVIRVACFSFRVLISESFLQEINPSVLGYRGEDFIAEYAIDDGYGVVITDNKLDIRSLSQIVDDRGMILANEFGNFWACPQEDLGIVTVNSTAIRKRVRLRHNDELGWSEGKLVIIEPRQLSADSGSLPRVENLPRNTSFQEPIDEVVEESMSPIFDPGDTLVIKSQHVRNNLTKVYLGGTDKGNIKSQTSIRTNSKRDKSITKTFTSDESQSLLQLRQWLTNFSGWLKQSIWRRF